MNGLWLSPLVVIILAIWIEYYMYLQAMMQETRLDPVRHQRATIDYRDTCLLRLHSVLRKYTQNVYYSVFLLLLSTFGHLNYIFASMKNKFLDISCHCSS